MRTDDFNKILELLRMKAVGESIAETAKEILNEQQE